MATKILLIGSTGNLGSAIKYQLQHGNNQEKFELICPTTSELDLSISVDEMTAKLKTFNADIIINAAAYTAVDLAEDEPGKCEQINTTAPEAIAQFCNDTETYFVHFSTDYVFDGKSNTPYQVTDDTQATGVYAQSKLNGEKAALKAAPNQCAILRVSWLFGDQNTGFVPFIIDQALQEKSIKAITDQVGSPTYTYSVAELIPELLEKKPTGILHANNSGNPISRYDQAVFILNKMGYTDNWINTHLTPAKTQEFFTKAPRPSYTALIPSFKQNPTWQDATEQYLLKRGLLKDLSHVC